MQRVLVELEQAQIAVQELEGLQRGELTVGTVQTVNAYMTPCFCSFLPNYFTSHPGVVCR